MNNQIKYGLFALINFVFVVCGFAQTTTTANVAPSDFNISINTALACIAVILLFIIIMLTVTVNQAVDFYKQKNDDAKKDNGTNIKPIAILLGLLAISQVVFSQETAAAATPVVDNSAQHAASIYMYSFIILILVEVAVILFLLKSIRFLTGIEKQQSLKSANSSADSFWSKINNLKPIEEEASLDTGHSYDGIRELDNITPPWFTAGIYCYYHLCHCICV
jgi:cytochrome c oxidase cbb3-type subunit 3